MRNVPGEGDCMFLAVALATCSSMGLGGNYALLRAISNETRNVVAQVLSVEEGNLYVEGKRIVRVVDLLKSAARKENCTPAEYIEKIRCGSLQGGGPELTVLSNVLRRPISVYELDMEHEEFLSTWNRTGDEKDVPDSCPIKCVGSFGQFFFQDPCFQIPHSAILQGIQKNMNCNYLSGEANESLCSKLKSLVMDGEPATESTLRIEIHEDDSKEEPSVSDKTPHKNEKSLLEFMMDEGFKAKIHLDTVRSVERRQELPSATYGLKKGFLNRMDTKVKKKKMKKIDIVVGPFNKKSVNSNPLEIVEVQEAMSSSRTSVLCKSIENVFQSSDLLNRIQENATLTRGMNDPECMAALNAFQQNPKQAMEKFRDYPKINEFMNEMCSILGDHFIELSKHNDAVEHLNCDQFKDSNIMTHREEQDGKRSSAVDDIVKDEELTSLLLDVDIQRVMRECSLSSNHTSMYLSDSTYGPKLRRLMNAGLLRLEY